MLHAWKSSTLLKAANEFFELHDYRKRAPANAEQKFMQVVKGKIDYIGMVRGRESRAHLKLLSRYASLNPNYKWPEDLPPRELDLKVLETAIFAVETPHSQGTAFNLSGVGLITCAHVVEGQQQLSVRRQGDIGSFAAHVIHFDKDRDLALLGFATRFLHALPKFEISKEPAEKLDQIVLMGYPTAGPALSSSIDQGAVTGTYIRFGQARHSISCTIYQGNSGGPVLDRNYRLIGVAANGISKKDSKAAELMGVIPISILSDFLTQVPSSAPS
jgi:S1-C subfamily serine protease